MLYRFNDDADAAMAEAARVNAHRTAAEFNSRAAIDAAEQARIKELREEIYIGFIELESLLLPSPPNLESSFSSSFSFSSSSERASLLFSFDLN